MAGGQNLAKLPPPCTEEYRTRQNDTLQKLTLLIDIHFLFHQQEKKYILILSSIFEKGWRAVLNNQWPALH
jgi:hypothetical protein